MKGYKLRLCSVLLAFSILITSVPTAASEPYSPQTASSAFYQALKTLDSVYYESIDYEKIVESAIKAAFGELDRYTEYMTEQDYNEFYGIGQVSKAGIGISMRLTGRGDVLVLDVFSGSPAEKAGIKAKDIMTKINGNEVAGRNLDEIKNMIAGEAGTSANITVIRDAAEKNLTVTRGNYTVPTVQKKDLSSIIKGADSKRVAYVVISSFVGMEDKPEVDTSVQFKKIYDSIKQEGIKNLIIDLRSNPGGDLETLLNISDILVKEGVICQTVDNEGKKQIFLAGKDGNDFNLAVLVNKDTASSSEILASAIQESGSGVIIGTNTFGKGVGQVIIPAIDGSHYMKITAFEIITRNGNKLNEIGVTPDIPVTPPPYIYAGELIDSESADETINELKAALSYIGYKVDTTKKGFDRQLTDSLKKFQKDAKLLESGLCTVDTIAAINRYVTDKYSIEDEALETAYKHLTK